MSPRNVIDTLYKDTRLAIQNYISPKERVVTAERAKFLSVIQGVGESDDDFLARLREEARYCDFEKLETAANPEEELVIIKFISSLREPEAKLRLLDGIKAKPAMSVTEMTESLQFRSQAMAFSGSSSGNEPFNVKEEVGFNFEKTFRKPNEKITAIKSNNMCTRCGGKRHSSRTCPALSEKGNTYEKVGLFSKMCRSKPQPNSGKYNKQNNFCEGENVSSEQASPASKMGMFYTKEQIFSMSVTCENISINNYKVKMQVDTSADSTVISKMWTELGKPHLDGKIRHLEAYDGHQLGSRFWDHLLVTLNGTEARSRKKN